MRMPVIRLLYVLVGAALVAGVLASAFDRPEAKLAAAESCYGPCPSLTALSLSTSTVTFGSEQAVDFRVIVGSGAPGALVPTGDVAVQAGLRTLCVIRLFRGLGSCSPASTALPPGTHQILARYAGDPNFASSTSSLQALTVLSPSATGLALSQPTVAYGNQQFVAFRVIVGGPGTLVPTGDVAVQSGGRTLCLIRLFRGLGNCSPAPRTLPRGRWAIVAAYSGDASFASSTSSPAILLVR